MKLSLPSKALKAYVEATLDNQMPDGNSSSIPDNIFSSSLERLDICFTGIRKKYYFDDVATFSHLNSDQFCTLIYFISNESFSCQREDLAEKLFYLNKIMHGLDLFYSVKLPEIFLMVHPVGTVIGNAAYQNHSVFYQNVTIGSNPDGKYPVFSGPAIFFSGCSVIGDCLVGENVIFGANTFVLKSNIEANSLVTGQYNLNMKITPTAFSIKKDFFGDIY